MSFDFVLAVVFIITIYLLVLELGVWCIEKIKDHMSKMYDEFEEVGIIDFDEEVKDGTNSK